MNRMLSSASAALFLFASAAVAERTVYLESFDHLADRVACFNEGTSVIEVESGGLKGLRFAPMAPGAARRGFFHITESPTSRDWTLTFKFNFRAGAFAHAFALDLYFGDRAKPEMFTIQISDAGARFGAGSIPAPADGADGLLPDGNWDTATLTAEDGHARLWLRRAGVLGVACEGTLPKAPLVGWNLSMGDNRLPVANEKTPCGNVSIHSFRVTDGTARPYAVGDPDEWLPELAAGKPEEMPANFGAPLSNKVARAVDLDARDLAMKLRLSACPTSRAERVTFTFVAGTNRAPYVSFAMANDQISLARRRYCAAGGAFSNATETVTLTNHSLSVSGAGVLERTRVHARPPLARLYRYRQPEVNQIWAAYDKLPKLTDRVFDLVLRKTGDNAYTLWLDGNVISSFTAPAPVTAVRVDGLAPASALRAADVPAQKASRVYELPFGKWPEGFRLSRVRENQGTYALECNAYLSRSAFDAMPSSCLFSVPNRQYVRAKALCRVDDKAPADFVPEITARLTEFFPNGGRSHAMCEKTVRLPAPGEEGPLPEGVVRKGANLYEVTFDLDIGFLMDMNFMDDGMARHRLDHLDFEFTGVLWEKNRYYIDRWRSPSPERQSSVVVLGGSLEESPATFEVRMARPFGLYYPDEQPAATVAVTPLETGEYTVETVVTDDNGKVVQKDAYKVGAPDSREVRLTCRDYGHYNVAFTLRDAAGARLVGHDASYVNLPPDTRKAGYDSLYYCWNFRGAHGSPRSPEEWGEAFKRIGIRRTLLNTDANAETNPVVKALGLTQAQFPYLGRELRPRGKDTDADAHARVVKHLCHLREIFPHCHTALLFHESGGGPFPKELYGEKTDVTPEVAAADSNRVATAVAYAKAWREADPTVRLIVGNSGDTDGLLAQLMRGGFPREYMDAMGEESVGMTMPPEQTTALTPWRHRRLAELYGYGDVPNDCPFEWKCRPGRDFPNEDMCLGMNHRDLLIAHALGYTMLPVGAGFVYGNSYYDTVWGGGGTFSRWPLAYPSRGAAANATHTLLFDQVKFRRMLPTGSLTAYCLEFSRAEGDWLYAFWTARGEVDASLDFGGKPLYTLVNICGDLRENCTDAALPISEVPRYIVSKKPLAGVSVALSRTYRHESYAGSDGAVVAADASDAAACALDDAEDLRIKLPFDYCPRRPGAFAVSTVDDPEQGSCTEIAHLSATNCPALMMEYVWLRFPEAKPVEGRPTTIGALVKGNSSWDKLFFEFRDAEGETWVSCGSGGYGCDVYDWPCQASLNFDGWHLVQFPITAESPVKVFSPGDDEWQWCRDGETGNGKIDYPITVTGLGIGARSQTLDILEMKPVTTPVRLKAIKVY